MPSRDAGARWPARMSCSSSMAARSLSVVASVTGRFGWRSEAGIGNPLLQDQLRCVELGLQHLLRRHDLDPPGELLGLKRRLGAVRRRRLDQLDRLLGELGDRIRSFFKVIVYEIGGFRERIAGFLYR